MMYRKEFHVAMPGLWSPSLPHPLTNPACESQIFSEQYPATPNPTGSGLVYIHSGPSVQKRNLHEINVFGNDSNQLKN